MKETTMLVRLNLKTPKIKTVTLSESPEKVEKMYIDGQWVSADTGRTFKVYNPATGELVAKVADSSEIETKQAINSAHLAFKVKLILL